jgi:hypothetical protein
MYADGLHVAAASDHLLEVALRAELSNGLARIEETLSVSSTVTH